jgi:hypothetical protein
MCSRWMGDIHNNRYGNSVGRFETLRPLESIKILRLGEKIKAIILKISVLIAESLVYNRF